MLRGEGKTFLVQFLVPTGHLKILELFWSLQVYRKKNTKNHAYSRLFSPEKRRLIMQLNNYNY